MLTLFVSVCNNAQYTTLYAAAAVVFFFPKLFDVKTIQKYIYTIFVHLHVTEETVQTSLPFEKDIALRFFNSYM